MGVDKDSSVAARRRAVEIIDGVLRYRYAIEDSALDKLELRERNFARAVIGLSLRRKGEADAVIANFLTKPLPRSAGITGAILLTAAAQILFMRVPDHAAINEAVNLARSSQHAEHFAGLVNAVLRKVAEQGGAVRAKLDVDRINTPDWLWKRWADTYGEETTRRIAAIHREEPPLDLSMKPGFAPPFGVSLPTGSVRVAGEIGRVEEMAGYASGQWWVQDLAAALPAKLLGDVSGLRVADLCAAPGGKTAQLAAAGAEVTAVDVSARRLQRLVANLTRLDLSAHIVQSDVLGFKPETLFDAVLLDAPCSATGTIRRHPELPWIKTEKQIGELAGVQAKMLAHAARMLRPGGLLVYCTCSLEPEEGEGRIAEFLKQNPGFTRVPIEADEIGGLSQAITALGDLRTLPFFSTDDAIGMDGFFAARLRLT